MKKILIIIQIIISILLMAAILIQARGTGLGSAWGGGGEFYRSKRGVERIVFAATIILAAAFLLISIINPLFG